MANRSIDYYIKGLGIETRQEIYSMLREVNPSIIKKLLEKEDDYPTWRRMGIDNDGIQMLLSKSIEKFSSINKIMTDNNRPPLFKSSKDTYGAAQKYVELLKEKTEEELEEEFGCSWEDYKPTEYHAQVAEAPDFEE